jgi:hypothetical protein
MNVNIVVGEPEEVGPLGRLRRGCKDDIKMHLNKIYVLDSFSSELGQLAGLSGSLKCGIFLDYLSNCQLAGKN